MDDDTPRSYASPRDDRFFTPRTIARSNSATSNSDEWNSPRDYQTPRTYDTDRKDSGRLSQRSNGSKDGGVSYGGGPAVDVRGYYANSYDQYQYQAQPRPQAQAKASERDEKQFADEAAAVSSSSSAHVSEQDIEDIFSFTRHGRAEEIERLLSKGIPVDIRDAFGNTLLIIACQNGNKRITKALLRRGANINARNYKGNTPLHYCYHCKPPCPLPVLCMPSADALLQMATGTVWGSISSARARMRMRGTMRVVSHTKAYSTPSWALRGWNKQPMRRTVL